MDARVERYHRVSAQTLRLNGAAGGQGTCYAVPGVTKRLETGLLSCVACVAILAGWLAAPAMAAAQPARGVMLSWVRGEGADDCLDQRELAAAVRLRLGYDPFHEPIGRVLEGTVTREHDRWVARLFNRGLEGAAGSRRLQSEADDCRSLDNPIVLSLALAIDPAAALAPPPDPPSAESEPGPELEPELTVEAVADSAPTVAVEERPERRADGVVVTLGAVVSHGLLPGWGVGARLRTHGPLLRWMRWRVAMSYWPEQRAERDGADFGIGLTGLSVGACAGQRWGQVSLHGCMDVELGVMHSVVFSPAPSSPGDEVWGAAYADLRVALHAVGPIEVALHGGLAVPLHRLRYRVAERTEVVFEPSVVAPTVGVDIGVRFF